MTNASDPGGFSDGRAAANHRIVVTGAAGSIGGALLAHLAADSDGNEVVAIDHRVVGGPASARHRLDVLVDDLAPVFAGATAVVHLAGSPDCSPDDPAGRAVVEGTRRVLAAAGAAEVPLVVRPSSTAVYGAWANNPEFIGEDAPLRPCVGFGPAVADAECERLLAGWAQECPGRVASRPRLAPVVGGPTVSAPAAAALGRAPVRVRGAAPVVQVLHVADAARVLAAAAHGRLPGVWNVAADGVIDPRSLGRGLRIPGLSDSAAARALDACWAAGRFGASGSFVPYLEHRFTVDTARLAAAGIVPALDATAAAAAATADSASDAGRRRAAVLRSVAGVIGAAPARFRRREGADGTSRPSRP